MKLWTDLVTPMELTTVARVTVEERERDRVSLSQFLPNKFVDDIDIRMTTTENGLVETAEYRAYDAETPIGSRRGGKRVTLELPPLGQKIPVSEYDRLRSRSMNVPDSGKDLIGSAAVTVARATADRVEKLRGEVLVTGKAVIDENQFIAEQDFGRDSKLTSTAGVTWDQVDTANPIEDLQKLAEAYTDINGESPGYLVVSQKIITSLIRNLGICKMHSGQNPPAIVTVDFLRATLESFDLPQLVKYDRKVRTNGVNVRVIDEKVALFLPMVEGEESPLGRTFWGTTLEASDDPRYEIAEDDRPGIVVGAYKEEDPQSTWVRANAIGMPVLGDANYSAALTVFA